MHTFAEPGQSGVSVCWAHCSEAAFQFLAASHSWGVGGSVKASGSQLHLILPVHHSPLKRKPHRGSRTHRAPCRRGGGPGSWAFLLWNPGHRCVPPPPTPQAHCCAWVRSARPPGAGPDSAARLPGLKFQLNATLGEVLSSGHLTELCEDPVVPAVRVRQCPDTHQLWLGGGAPDNARRGRGLRSHPAEWLGGWSPQTHPSGCPPVSVWVLSISPLCTLDRWMVHGGLQISRQISGRAKPNYQQSQQGCDGASRLRTHLLPRRGSPGISLIYATNHHSLAGMKQLN